MTDASHDPTRRDFLRLAAAAGLLGPAALGCRGSDPAIQKAAPHPDHLSAGLVLLADAHHRGWLPGHEGAAVLAAHYFCVDNALDERTTAAVRSNIDAFMSQDPTRRPTPRPGPGTADPARIVERLDAQIPQLRSGGHDAIYAALALRALRDRPDLATPAVVDGIVKLLEYFAAHARRFPETPYNAEHPLPEYRGAEDVADVTLRAILCPWNHVRTVGASGVVHWVTHAEALITLEELGYGATARRGHAAHRLHVNREPVDGRSREPDREPFDWLRPAYWESDAPRRLFGGTWLAGHAFKLPHSLFRLLKRTEDQDLRTASLARAAKLTIPFE